MIGKLKTWWLLGLMLVLTASVASQTLPPPRAASEFNVEIFNFGMPKYVGSVPAAGEHAGLYGNANLRRTADWKPSADVPLAAAVLKVEFWLEQGSVRVEVQAYLGEIPPNSRPPDWEKLPKIKIASRLMRVDETTTVEETRRVGIEPFQLKVARTDPWSVGPPEIVNQTQALNVESTTEERPAYTVTVRNVSTKNITGIQWYGSENDHRVGGSGIQGARVIAAGKLFQIHQHFANSESNKSGESKPELPQRRQIVIAAVLFDDGSFEGEPDVAAGMAATLTGQSLQLSRIVPLLESAAANPDQDQAALLTKLRTDIDALSEEIDPAIAAKVLTFFPNVSDEMRQRLVIIRFKAGLKLAKSDLFNEIGRFEYQRAHASETKDVRTWLGQLIAKYKTVQSPYR